MEGNEAAQMSLALECVEPKKINEARHGNCQIHLNPTPGYITDVKDPFPSIPDLAFE